MHAKPAWVRDYVSSLDGLRGIAIAIVVLFHCGRECRQIHLGWVAQWGWTGVNLFFVLSGYLITGILLESRGDPHYFRNFYARRALRIWPVYFLLILPVTYLVYGHGNLWNGATHGWKTLTVGGVPWLYFILFLQNLTPGLAGTIYPSWSLAIEEQFYFLWAPIARLLKPSLLLLLLVAVFLSQPICRTYLWQRLPSINTVLKLDGLAVGGLIALGMRMTRWSQRIWRGMGWAGMAAGAGAVLYAWSGGGAWYESLLALGFGGMVVAAVAEPVGNLYQRSLEFGPLMYLGTVSYGLYLIHMPVFAIVGELDVRMKPYGARGALVVVVTRVALSLLVATLSWYGLEKPILRLKRHFIARKVARAVPVEATVI